MAPQSSIELGADLRAYGGGGRLPWSTLDALVQAVRAFIDPLLGDADGAWNPEAWAWSSAET
jgi:hypothetical protein